jgi:hypothetical protein
MLTKRKNMVQDQEHQIITEVANVAGKWKETSQAAALDVFLSCYDNAAGFVYISSDGKTRNYADFSNICTGYYQALRDQRADTHEETFHVLAQDLVIHCWTGNILAQFKNGSMMKMNNYTVTNVFKKLGDTWKIIYSHESALPPEMIK